jgi:hypothetical protein
MLQPQIKPRRRRAVQHQNVLSPVPFEQQGRNVFGDVQASKDFVKPKRHVRGVALGDAAVWVEDPPLNGDIPRGRLGCGDLEHEVVVSHRPAPARC